MPAHAHAGVTFSPLYTPTLRVRMHSVTDRRTDEQQDDANSRLCSSTIG